MIKQTITPFLWFDGNAEDAVHFYVSVFPHSKVTNVARYGASGPGPKGTIMTLAFQLDGQEFVALNGGPHYKFTEAVSFVVNRETQQDVDFYWERLSEGGEKGQCGWLKDKYGLSWQIVPTALVKLLTKTDAEQSGKAMEAMMQMKKLDIEALEQSGAEAQTA